MAEREAIFQPWQEEKLYPNKSLPALEAAKCAEAQGEELYNRYHMALFRGLFGESRDISDPADLVRIAWECGLDVNRFAEDYANYTYRHRVMEEFKESLAFFSTQGVLGIPTVLFDGFFPLAGAHPAESYYKVVDKLLEARAKQRA
ncbi:MAG: DsbA family protein [Chloroflexi bacterium]|nr:DsbA family protein [Chloroflexota bacterium]